MAVTLTLSQQHPGLMLPVRVIHLTRGQFAIVDPEDYGDLARCKWRAQKGPYTWYAARELPTGQRSRRTIRMHAQLTGFAETDHANRDGLDNRRMILRAATRSQNLANTRLRRDNTSGYRGVTWDLRKRKWRATITVNGKKKHLGRFADPRDAAAAWQAAAQQHWGEFIGTQHCGEA